MNNVHNTYNINIFVKDNDVDVEQLKEKIKQAFDDLKPSERE